MGHLFTRENAREMARRGNIARWHNPKAQPSPAEIAAMSDAIRDAIPLETQKRLKRVRKQLDMVDSRIEEEACKQGGIDKGGKPLPACDGQLLNWLCSAQERLAEQERQLSGRPLPGTLKPTAPAKPPREKPAPVALPPVDPPNPVA